MPKPRTINTLLEGADSVLQRAIQRASQLNQLNRAVKSLLPVELADHCRVANLRDNCLIIHVDANVWATRLRYQTPELLKALHEQLKLNQARKIEIKVTPSFPSSVKTNRRATLSSDAAATITASAKHITHPALRTALERLAKHGKKS